MRTSKALLTLRKCPQILNRMLLALPSDLRDDIVRQCEHVELRAGDVLCSAGTRIEYAYFINGGLVSLLKGTEDGRSVEVGSVGIEGVVGVFSAYGFDHASSDFVVQVPGSALRIASQALKNEMAKHEALSCVVMRSIILTADQFAQISLCNRLHSLEQRFCHWLLVAHDNVPSDEFQLTHEFLALLLGVQRPSVSAVANALQKRGLIHYCYGRITIINRAALEDASCSCYATLRQQVEHVFGYQCC